MEQVEKYYFSRIENSDGSQDTQCRVCGGWVASCIDLAHLDQAERSHVCNLFAIPLVSQCAH